MRPSEVRALPVVVGLSCLLSVPGVVARGIPNQAQSAQTFRATTDLVTIDVHVRTGGDTVGGLSADDFVLLDNGVRQQVEIVALEAVPIDVSIVVDTGIDVSDDIDGMANHVRQIASLVRPQDSVRVMGVGPYVRDLVPAASNLQLDDWPTPATGGPTAAYDGLAAALLRPIGLDRRHLIIAVMNGIDGISTVPVDALHDIARRSGATLYVSAVDLSNPPGWNGGRERLDTYRCRATMICQPIRGFWMPYHEHRFEDLETVASTTGGKYYYPSLFTIATASAVFKRAFEDYRRNYLLRYSPRGVDREGWHEVEVSIPEYPGYEIRARRGYAIDRAGAHDEGDENRAEPPAGTAASIPADIAGIAAAYDQRDYGLVFSALRASRDPRALIESYLERPNPWPANPRREAAFVIELAQAGFQSPRPVDNRAGRDLLDTYAPFVQHPIEPDAFERYWLWASLAIALNNADRNAARMANAALERFPDEPRFVLARALAEDQSMISAFASLAPGERLAERTEESVDDVLTRYDAAISFSGTRHEASVRKAWVLHRIGRHDEALALLNAAGDAPDDATMTFMRHLFRARVLDALGRVDEAAGSYRQALEISPEAQSARMGLMTSLLQLGDREGAEGIADAIQATPDTAADPWWAFWSGDYRFFPAIIGRLRDQTR